MSGCMNVPGKVQCTVLLEAALMLGLRQLLPHLLASLLVDRNHTETEGFKLQHMT